MDSLRVSELKTDCLLPYIVNGVVGKLEFDEYTAIDFNNIPILNWNGPVDASGGGLPQDQQGNYELDENLNVNGKKIIFDIG